LYRPRIEGFSTEAAQLFSIPEVKALGEKWNKDFGPPPDGVGEPSAEIRTKYETDMNKFKKDLMNIVSEKSSHPSRITKIVSDMESMMKDMKTDVILKPFDLNNNNKLDPDEIKSLVKAYNA
jgi:hypothetical protein